MSFQRTSRTCNQVSAALLAFCALTCGGTSSARADACDDLARQLASQITGLKVAAARGGVIYLEHPTAKQAWLGCSGRNVKNEVSASSLERKPSKDFMDFVATASALVFTIPKSDTLAGAQRCVGRIGILRGNTIATRYRKLDIHCRRDKTTTQITISREREA